MPRTFSYKRTANFYETDAAKIVHFSNYFKYMEEAELAFIATFSQVDCTKTIWLRSHFSCEYYNPIRFDEAFSVDLTASVKPCCIGYAFCIQIGDQISAKGSYQTKPLVFSGKDQCFYETDINQKLINAING